MSIPKYICLPAPFATLSPESTPYDFQTANLVPSKKLANSKAPSVVGLPLTHSNLNKDNRYPTYSSGKINQSPT